MRSRERTEQAAPCFTLTLRPENDIMESLNPTDWQKKIAQTRSVLLGCSAMTPSILIRSLARRPFFHF